MIVRDHPGAPLQLRERGREADTLAVLGATLGAWDLARDGALPVLPGAVFALASPDPDDPGCSICGGYLPCGACGACLAGLPLACLDPVRPGWNRPGGLASHATPSSGYPPVELGARLPEALALLAAAGLTYQAMASVGMAPGDTAVVVGDPGPGSIPIRLLLAAGLRVLQLVEPSRAARSAPDGVLCTDRLIPTELPTARCHLLDLAPRAASLARWLPIAAHCRSATLCGLSPEPALTVGLDAALAGQCTLRWVRDLHPHLALDLCAEVVTGRVRLASEIAVFDSLETMVEPAEGFLRGEAERWPILLPRH